jgi:ECF sigma factor
LKIFRLLDMQRISEAPAGPSEISRLLGRWRNGEEDARDRVFSLVYDELRRRARHQLQRHGGADAQSYHGSP